MRVVMDGVDESSKPERAFCWVVELDLALNQVRLDRV